MNKNAILISLFFLLASCQRDDNSLNDCDQVFTYDLEIGKCTNCNGEVGYNPFNLEKIKSTKNAECIKIPKMHLVFLLDTNEIQDFNEFGYNEITDYNFRGSDLNDTELIFNHILNADLEGTKLSKLQIGYGSITGNIDAFTEYSDLCAIENDLINCQN